ncbi:MAG: AroM family protein [Sneathiella sp.]
MSRILAFRSNMSLPAKAQYRMVFLLQYKGLKKNGDGGNGMMQQNLIVITAGQTPRTEMLAETLTPIDCDWHVQEVGALDGLSYQDILELEPSPHEMGISTFLKDGRNVVISENWLRQKVLDLCQGRGRSFSDLTLIASTGVFDLGTTAGHVLHAQNSLDQFMESLIVAGQTVGLVYPLVGQPDGRGQGHSPHIKPGYAACGDEEALKIAGEKIGDCDFIVLNSMGYSEKDREAILQASGKPTILVRRIVAGTLAKILKHRNRSAFGDRLLDGSALKIRASRLTNRERQVFDQVLDGLSNKEIARMLDISHRTVEIHRARMLAKMGVSTSNELMCLIVQNISHAKF